MTCFSCPVRKECIAYKEETKSSDGIWGGEYSKRGKGA